MKTAILYLLLIVAITAGACKKEKLTPETQTGANTFSCKINGKVYKSKSDFLSQGLVGSISINKNGIYTFSIGSVMYRGDESGYAVGLLVSDFVGARIYDLRVETGYVDKTTSPTQHYSSKTNGSGSLNVEYLNKEAKIISGTFEFVAANIKNPNETINITEGRFDLKY
jgi:hypothetical protein